LFFIEHKCRKYYFQKWTKNWVNREEVRKIDFYNLLQSYKINDPCNWIGTVQTRKKNFYDRLRPSLVRLGRKLSHSRKEEQYIGIGLSGENLEGLDFHFLLNHEEMHLMLKKKKIQSHHNLRCI